MSVPVATVLSEGKSMDPTYQLLSLEVRRQINRVPNAHLVLVDGSVARQEFAVSNQAFFEPGKRIEILLRYEGEDDVSVFGGLVARHGVKVETERTLLQVELKDEAIKLTQPRKSAVYRDQTDDEAIGQLLDRAGLKAGTIDATTGAHAELVQFNASDWDFMLSRADVNGQVVVVEDGTVSVRSLDGSGDSVAKIEYGLDGVFELDLEVDATQQRPSVNSFGWDIAEQGRSSPGDAAAPSSEQGNLDGEKLATALGFSGTDLVHGVPLSGEELQAWADARMKRSRLALIRGRWRTHGRTDVKLLDLVDVAGIGERFNGKALIAGLSQLLDHDGWRTEFELGVSPEWYCHRQEDIAEAPASGLLPAVSGLQVGVVDAFEEDPAGEHRVRVRLPAFDDEQGSIWARVAWSDAGKERGQLAWPEPDDEVVVGFFNQDPRQAVILGAMFSSANTPPEAVGARTEDNFKKGLVTKSGAQIVIDDEKGSIAIQTPGENSVVIDDEAEAITIADQHGNTITLDADGITIATEGDFKVEAGGDVVLEGSAVDVK